MSKAAIGALVALALLATVPAAGARGAGKAAGREVLAEACAYENTICELVERRHGRIDFLLVALAPGAPRHFPLAVCVKPPRGPRECETFRATVRRNVVRLRIDFARHFRHSQAGRYVVTWRHEDDAVKRSLAFRFSPAPS